MTNSSKNDVLQRFFSQVDKGSRRDDCWVWQGARSEDGYGLFFGRTYANTRLAHRWHWVVMVGFLGPDEVLDHICRNRACVRLDHLRVVSAVENVLAGSGFTARNRLKTHCVNGHVLEEVTKSVRRCRICKREWQRVRKARARQQKAQQEWEAFRAEWNRLPNLGGRREPAERSLPPPAPEPRPDGSPSLRRDDGREEDDGDLWVPPWSW